MYYDDQPDLMMQSEDARYLKRFVEHYILCKNISSKDCRYCIKLPLRSEYLGLVIFRGSFLVRLS